MAKRTIGLTGRVIAASALVFALGSVGAKGAIAALNTSAHGSSEAWDAAPRSAPAMDASGALHSNAPHADLYDAGVTATAAWDAAASAWDAASLSAAWDAASSSAAK